MHRAVPFLLSWVIVLASPVLRAQQLDLTGIFEERNLTIVRQLLAKGNYDLCAQACESVIARGAKLPEWRLIRLRALMEMGQEEVAYQEVQTAVQAFPDHIELLMQQHDVAQSLGKSDAADQTLKAINMAARKKPTKDRSAAEIVALGKAALALGADAKKVIQQYFSVAQTKDPTLEDAYLAEGHLSLTKDNPKRAAEVFRTGLKAHGESANLRTGLALAFKNSDREQHNENLARALELNPAHTVAMLTQAELLISAEKFLVAEDVLQKVLSVRANCPEAWAMKAAIAYLSSKAATQVEELRSNGLKRWNRNPVVDHLLGRILSRAYRFAEGSAYQRKALELDPQYLPAKVQLCHDLLRLGHEDEAWKLAAEIRRQDGYNIQAHNIGQLEKEMQSYTTQAFDDFIIKMPKREWPIYGEQALALLREAKAIQCAKYGVELKRPILVEFFGSQQDFAIRTFGSLGGQGLLGVCFGSVITMNSPGSLAHGRNNWEATLWHEFSHVITLNITKNRMPRWLSEGISVYEEGQRNPVWGMSMNAEYREMIIDDKAITPISQLSSAFLNAKSEKHLMFAYFQSSQVVAFLMDRFGRPKFRSILEDLSQGKHVNEAIAAHTEPLDSLEPKFDVYLMRLAQEFGQKAEWKEPEPTEVNPLDAASFVAYLNKHPNSLWALRKQAADMIERGQWDEGIKAANALIMLLPDDFGGDSGYQLKAAALRKAGRVQEETNLLRLIAERDPGAMPVFLRLLELDIPARHWSQVRDNAQRAIALNPFLKLPQQGLAEAAQALDLRDEAIAAYQRILILEPANSAMTHFRLAKLLREKDATAAKRHLLDALAQAPRFREGYELLKSWQ